MILLSYNPVVKFGLLVESLIVTVFWLFSNTSSPLTKDAVFALAIAAVTKLSWSLIHPILVDINPPTE